MRLMVAVFIALVLPVACTQPAATSQTPTATAPAPAPADTHSLSQVFGSYRADDGRVFVIARLGWFFDVRTPRTARFTPEPRPPASRSGLRSPSRCPSMR